MRIGATLLMAAGLIMTQSGCSLLFMTSPPDTLPADPAQEISCTSKVIAPIVDTVIGVYQGVRTGVAVAADDSDYEDYPISRPVDIAFGVGFTALFVGSAVYGYASASECSEMKREAARRPVDAAIIPRPQTMAPAPLIPACTVDTQCKGDRICEDGRCVSPSPPPPPIEPAPPAALPSEPIQDPPPAPQPVAPAL